MIRSFRSKPLAVFWETGTSTKIAPALQPGIQRRLDALHEAMQPSDMNIPGFNFHRLRGKPVRYTVHVNGPWCVTFEWEKGDAVRVDFEQYH
jgi:proteic killer suppression protein